MAKLLPVLSNTSSLLIPIWISECLTISNMDVLVISSICPRTIVAKSYMLKIGKHAKYVLTN